MTNDKSPPDREIWPVHFDRVKARPEGKKRRYVAHYEHLGQHCKRALRTRNLEAARKAATLLETQLATGTLAVAPARKRIAEAVELFLESKKVDALAPSSLGRYRTELKCFEDYAAGVSVHFLDQITERVAQGYKVHRQQSRLGTGPADPLHEETLFVSVVAIKAFTKWCTRRGRLITQDPLQWFSMAKPPFVRKRAPTLEQINMILAKATMPRLAQYGFLAFTGARVSEMALMLRRDVDLAGKWLAIPTLKRKKTRIVPRRKVPLHPRLHRLLAEYLESSAGKPDDPLFPAPPSPKYPDGGHCLSIKKLNKQFQTTAAAVGLPVGRKANGLIVHSLRRFMETFAVNGGIPQRVIDAWLGHSGGASMGNVYYELHDDVSQDFMRRVPFGS